jgi:hypothetical protein
MYTELGTTIIRELKKIATVDVDITGTKSANISVIVVDTIKL